MHRTHLLLPGLVTVAAIALVSFAATTTSAAPIAVSNPSHAATPSLQKQLTFRNAMGKYWEDHITWTRLFIISALSDSPDLLQTTERLLQNQIDIGNAIKPYYGDAAGDQLTGLLRDHILIAADLVAAAKASDTTALRDAHDAMASQRGPDRRFSWSCQCGPVVS